MMRVITHAATPIRVGGHIFKRFLDQHGRTRQTIALAVTSCDGRGLRIDWRRYIATCILEIRRALSVSPREAAHVSFSVKLRCLYCSPRQNASNQLRSLYKHIFSNFKRDYYRVTLHSCYNPSVCMLKHILFSTSARHIGTIGLYGPE